MASKTLDEFFELMDTAKAYTELCRLVSWGGTAELGISVAE